MRLLKSGSPDRTKSYVFPGDAGKRVLLLSLFASVALAAALTALHFAGLLRIASPGPLVSGHALFDARCEQCHARRVALDLRCERCHDPSGGEEWRVRAHESFGQSVSGLVAASPSARRSASKTSLRCGECHGDHRGRTFDLKRVDDRQCVRCHAGDTPSLARHVEFAVVRGKKTPLRGIKISHDRHTREAVARLLGKKTAELTAADTSKYQSGPALQQACETCHVATSDLRGFEPIAFGRHCAACHLPGGSVGATDPLPIADVMTVDRIRSTWAAGIASQFTVRRDRITKNTLEHQDPWVLLNLAKLRREVDPAGYLADRSALVDRIDRIRRVGQSFPLARASDAALAQRLQALDAKLLVLTKPPTSSPDADRHALSEGVSAYRALAADVPGAGAAGEALARAATAASAGSLTPLSAAEEALRWAELLDALESVRDRAKATGDILLGRRVDDLRRRILVSGLGGSAEQTDLRQAWLDERDRLADERDFRRHASPSFLPFVSRIGSLPGLERDAQEAGRRLQALALLEGVPFVPADAAARPAKLETAAALMVPCQKCHEAGVAAFLPIAIDSPVMPRALFDHKPHVRIRACADCHAIRGGGVLTSKSAEDVLVPTVAVCRECHKPSQTRADCATCHVFHPPSYPLRVAPRLPATSLVASETVSGAGSGAAREVMP